jgi:hypothetical protein
MELLRNNGSAMGLQLGEGHLDSSHHAGCAGHALRTRHHHY